MPCLRNSLRWIQIVTFGDRFYVSERCLFVFLVRERNNLAFFSSPACTKLAAGLEIESLEKWKKHTNNQRGGPTDNQQWHKKNRLESLILEKQFTCLQRYLHHNTHDNRCERRPDPKQRWLTGHFLQRAKLSFYFSHKLMDESALLLKEIILQPSLQRLCAALLQQSTWKRAEMARRAGSERLEASSQWQPLIRGQAGVGFGVWSSAFRLVTKHQTVNWPRAGLTSLDPDHIICTRPFHSTEVDDANNNVVESLDQRD